MHAHLYRGTLTRSSSEFDLCMSYLRHISSARSSSSLGIFFGMEIQGSMSWRQKVLPTYITSIRIGIVSTIMVPHLHCFGGVGIMDILCVHTHMQLAVGNDPRARVSFEAVFAARGSPSSSSSAPPKSVTGLRGDPGGDASSSGCPQRMAESHYGWSR